jgi:hypothetical protein
MQPLPFTAIVSTNLRNRLSSEIFVHTHPIAALYPEAVNKVLAMFGENRPAATTFN